MSAPVPRLRMFAGPNGWGKSTIKSVFSPELLGVYINPDEIEDEIRFRGFLDLRQLGVETTQEEILAFFGNSPLAQKAFPGHAANCLLISDGRLSLGQSPINSYFPSIVADFLRQHLLEQQISFTFETVMSSLDKVRLLEKGAGARVSHLSVLRGDRCPDHCAPIINISRVKNRVRMGATTFRRRKSSAVTAVRSTC